jgi:hypothetical protein
MARDTMPLKIAEDQIQVSQASQGEGDQNQDAPKGLPPPGATVPDQPPASTERQQTGGKNRDSLNVARFLVELITLAVLLWYTILTRGLWKEADRANTLAQEAVRIAERPWIAVDAGLSSPVIFYETGQVYVGVRTVLRNVGHSVATDIMVHSGVVPFSHRNGLSYEIMQAPEKRRDALCEELRQFSKMRSGGLTVFPEQEAAPDSWILIGNENALEEWAVALPHTPGKFINLLLVGCVVYRAAFFTEPYITGFVYSIQSTLNNGYLRLGETLPIEHVRLFPYALIPARIE